MLCGVHLFLNGHPLVLFNAQPFIPMRRKLDPRIIQLAGYFHMQGNMVVTANEQ
jgi:hypothetical protein